MFLKVIRGGWPLVVAKIKRTKTNKEFLKKQSDLLSKYKKTVKMLVGLLIGHCRLNRYMYVYHRPSRRSFSQILLGGRMSLG